MNAKWIRIRKPWSNESAKAKYARMHSHQCSRNLIWKWNLIVRPRSPHHWMFETTKIDKSGISTGRCCNCVCASGKFDSRHSRCVLQRIFHSLSSHFRHINVVAFYNLRQFLINISFSSQLRPARTPHKHQTMQFKVTHRNVPQWHI